MCVSRDRFTDKGFVEEGGVCVSLVSIKVFVVVGPLGKGGNKSFVCKAVRWASRRGTSMSMALSSRFFLSLER